jgi:type IV pilus assembly protein PilN
MIRINLLPVKEWKAEAVRRQELLIGTVSLGAVVALIVAVYLYQSYRVSALQNQRAALRKEVEALNVTAKEVVDLQERIKEFQSKNKVIEEINKRKSGPVRIMESLAAATPNALWLTEFKEAGGALTMSGVAIDNQTIAEFLKVLANYPYFTNTELIETTQSEQAGMPPRKFLIKANLSYQPVAPANTVEKPAGVVPAAQRGNSG